MQYGYLTESCKLGSESRHFEASVKSKLHSKIQKAVINT